MMTQVICLKLTSGEELVAKLHESQRLSDDATQVLTESKLYPGDFSVANTGVMITEPLVIGMQPVGPNRIGVGFMPWAVGNTNKQTVFTIRAEALATVPYPASVDIERGYLQQISGIDLSGGALSKPN